jgi:hypothetical protein
VASNSGAKEINKTIRLSQEQWRRAKKAAALETKRIGATVYPTVLIAEVGMDGIDAILAVAQPPAESAA